MEACLKYLCKEYTVFESSSLLVTYTSNTHVTNLESARDYIKREGDYATNRRPENCECRKIRCYNLQLEMGFEEEQAS